MKSPLLLPSKLSQWLTFIVSVLAATAVTFFLLLFLNSFNQTSLMFRVANAWHIQDSLIYTTYSDFNLSDEEKRLERDIILATDGVLDTNIVTAYRLYFPSIEPFSITCINYSDSLLENRQYDLVEGSYSSIDQPNQIFLPARYQGVCQIGDVVTGYDTSFNTLENPDEKPVAVTVAGFLAERQPVLRIYAGGTGLDLSSLFATHTSFLNDEIKIEDGIVFNLYDTNGTALPALYSDLFLIQADGSVPPDTLKKTLSSKVMSPSLLHSGNEMILSHFDENTKEISETLVLLLTSFVLSFSILTASTALELVYRQKEMSILYLCGASWNRCIWSTLFSQILPVVIGFPLGLLLVASSRDWHLFYILEPKLELSTVLVAVVIEALFVTVAVIPFRFLSKFKTPYELFRKD